MSYQINNHRLSPATSKKSPNQAGYMQPRYLLMHFTAGTTASGAVSWFENKDSKVSAHLVIDRAGKITQMVDFNRVAWHAGKSRWADLSGLNSQAIGIELVNAGRLVRSGGKWRSWSGTVIPDAEVLIAPHRNDPADDCGWHIFTEKQIEVAAEVCAALSSEYQILDVLGHDDISPTRKNDPGPAFDLAAFRTRALGSPDGEPQQEFLVAAPSLNIRTEPHPSAERVVQEGLRHGTRVVPSGEQFGAWWFVQVTSGDLEGWVHSHYLRGLTDSPADRFFLPSGFRSFRSFYVPPSASAHLVAHLPFEEADAEPGRRFKELWDRTDATTNQTDSTNCQAVLKFPDGTVLVHAKMSLCADGSPLAKEIDPPYGQISTSLSYPPKKAGGPRCYINAEEVPYIVLPLPHKGNDSFEVEFGIKLGDTVRVIYRGGYCDAIFADRGPGGKFGEGSIALHEQLPCASPWKTSAKKRLSNTSVTGDVLYLFNFQNGNI